MIKIVRIPSPRDLRDLETRGYSIPSAARALKGVDPVGPDQEFSQCLDRSLATSVLPKHIILS